MFVAIDETGKRIYATEDCSKDNKYYCPVCHGEVYLRAGSINTPHFAHVNLQDCDDDFTNDMSEWHREWQQLFPTKNREVVITNEGETHRADVLCYGTVIEFQHSSISESEFWRRNMFYNSAGYKVIWIFDMIDLCEDIYSPGKIQHIEDWHYRGDNGGKYRWKHPWRFLGEFMPQDESNVEIFFQMSPLGTDPKNVEEYGYMEKVVWVNPDYKTLWGWFHTSYNIPNYFELLKYLKNRWLLKKK